MAAAGPAPHTTTASTRPFGCHRAAPIRSGELLGVPADAGRGERGKITGERADRRPGGDLFGCGLFCRAQRRVGLLVAAPLEERPGDVDEEAGLPFGDGDRGEVDPAGQVDGCAGVSEGNRDVDLVQLGVDRAEGGPAQVGVRAEPAGGVGRFGEHLVRGAALVVLGGGDGTAEQD